MSGICAVWRKENLGRVAQTLAAVTAGLRSVSSDQTGQQIDRNTGVGVSARFATQQIYSNPHVLVACDVDLQNEADLMAVAGDLGHAPVGARSAALMAALYERFGSAFPQQLQGAFSVVLWDRQRKQLFAAVDHFGIKRLAYYQAADVLLIGSRIDALLQSGEISRDINPRAIANVVNFSINTAPETAFTQVFRIPPGSFLLSSDGKVRIEKYWDMRYGVGQDSDEERLSRELERVVEKSVAARSQDLAFDTVGAFLSGGTDSSTVVGMMARTGRGSVNAFSIGFEEQSFNELEYAELAAKRFNATHRTYLVSAADCFHALPDMVRSFDEPFGNSSAIPTYFCARLASQHGVKVLLAGDGGDELFGGNEAYRTEKIFERYQNVPGALRKGVIEPLLSALPFENGIVGKARRYVAKSNTPPIERILAHLFLSTHPVTEVFEPEFVRELNGFSLVGVLARYFAEAPATEHLDKRLYADVKTVLGDSDLPKVTCMSELAGVQARFPFLDRSVAEFSGHIPARLKVKGLEKRYLFKKAFRELLPVEIIQKRKHGFGIPVAVWMKTDRRMRELLHDVVLSNRSLERGYFRREFVQEMFRQYETDATTYYGDTLWTLLVLELWHRQFVDQPLTVGA